MACSVIYQLCIYEYDTHYLVDEPNYRYFFYDICLLSIIILNGIYQNLLMIIIEIHIIKTFITSSRPFDLNYATSTYQILQKVCVVLYAAHIHSLMYLN